MADLSALRDVLDGTLLQPGDETWDAARLGWSSYVDQQPRAVVHAVSVADVQATVRFAAEAGLTVTAQPRGHGASHALDGAILLRTGALDDLDVDPDDATAHVGAGVSWGRVQAALDGTGLTGLAGSNGGVTVVGYLLGGGLSWFGRAYGVGARCLRAADVVDANGEVRRVDAETDPDLLWALRGGGGDFGIVTSVEIDLFPAPQIFGGRVVVPGEAAPEVFGAYTEVTRTAPEELSVWLSRMHVPDVPQMPEEIRGRTLVQVDAVFLGDPEAGSAYLEPFRTVAPVLRETLRPLKPGELGTVAEEPEDGPPPGVTPVMAAEPLTTFDTTVAEQVVTRTERESGITVTGVRHLGGAMTDPPVVDGAGLRVRAGYLLSAMAMAPTPQHAAAATAALQGLTSGLAPWRIPSSVLTFLGKDAPLSAAYDAATVARLQEVKRSVDPRGVFRSNHPVLEG